MRPKGVECHPDREGGNAHVSSLDSESYRETFVTVQRGNGGIDRQHAVFNGPIPERSPLGVEPWG